MVYVRHATTHESLGRQPFFWKAMPVAKPREVATPTPTGQEGAPAPAAAHRGRRLGKGARRDLRWALRQHPGDDVREIMLHGVIMPCALRVGLHEVLLSRISLSGARR